MKSVTVVLSTVLALGVSSVSEAGDPRQAPDRPTRPHASQPADAPPPVKLPGVVDDQARRDQERDRRERERAERERETTLGREEVQRTVFADAIAIRDCYHRYGFAQRRATGELALHLIVHRDGSLFRFAVVAPGVRGQRLFRCLEQIAAAWQFPPRKGFTDAIVPFRYVHTAGPGSGPYKSCWSPRGCRRKNTSSSKTEGGSP